MSLVRARPSREHHGQGRRLSIFRSANLDSHWQFGLPKLHSLEGDNVNIKKTVLANNRELLNILRVHITPVAYFYDHDDDLVVTDFINDSVDANPDPKQVEPS